MPAAAGQKLLWIGQDDADRPFTLPASILTHTVAILAKKGAGKRLSLDTPLATPDGWTTMGEVAVGDVLFDELGQPCRVSYVGPVAFGDAYRVRFSDGSVILADAEHVWLTSDIAYRRAEGLRRHYHGGPASVWSAQRPQCQRRLKPTLRTTAEIRATLITADKLAARNHAIDNAAPLQTSPVDLAIDPYVLGVWLGDGTATSSCVSVGRGAEAILGEIERAGYRTKRWPSQPIGYNVAGLQQQLRAAGLLRNKHVPREYLRACPEQRLALLQGLLDTDGGWSRRTVEFSSCKPELADAVYELVVSLGMKATRAVKPTTHQDAHIVRFTPTIQVFRLPAKAQRWCTGAQIARRRRRYIVAVQPVQAVPMRCIAVDSPSHLYLAGSQMVPTHNTYLAGVLEEEFAKQGLPFVVLDPVGVHYGIRSDRDGRRSAYGVVVFGGRHGDIPIERHMGSAVAQAVVEENLSCIVDLTELSKTAWREFTRDFCRELYRTNSSPRHVFIEEATEFVPQTRRPELQEAYEAVERLVRAGRNRGLGCTLISQRSAQVAKDVLTQMDVLMALRTVGPQDRRALLDMFESVLEEHQLPQLEEFKRTIARLPDGTAWVWSPEFLGCFRQVKIRQRETYHAGATPTFETQKLVQARPDVSALKARLATAAGLAADAPTRRAVVDFHKMEERCRQAQSEAAEWKANAGELRAEIERLRADLDVSRQESAQWRQRAAQGEELRSALLSFLSWPGEVLVSGPEPEILEATVRRLMGELGSPSVQLVAPEALRTKYLQAAVDRLTGRLAGLGPDAMEAVRLLLGQDRFWSVNRVALALGGSDSGGTRARWSKALQELVAIGLVSRGGSGRSEYKANVRGWVQSELAPHGASDGEAGAVVDNVVYRIAQDARQL